jgi:glucosylceramidase
VLLAAGALLGAVATARAESAGRAGSARGSTTAGHIQTTAAPAKAARSALGQQLVKRGAAPPRSSAPKCQSHATSKGKRVAKCPARPKPKPKPKPKPTSPVAVTQTSSDLTEAFSRRAGLRFSASGALPGIPVIHVNDTAKYQLFTGVGGAMTDSSAWLIWDELPPLTRSTLMNELFGSAGFHLSFLRVPIGGSDFTVGGTPYTYDDQPAGQSDPTLADFSIAHDEAYILPALREAQALNPTLYLEAVPWSPPAWMKANDLLSNLGDAGSLLPSDYGPYANYFVKFLKAYAAERVRISAITPQNEPHVPTSYPGLSLTAQQQASFITGYLHPALQSAGLDPSVFGWDLSWGPLGASNPLVAATTNPGGSSPGASSPTAASTTGKNGDGIAKSKVVKRAAAQPAADSSERQAITPDLRRLIRLPTATLTGLAWHCYHGSPTMMRGVHAASPGVQQIVDECTTGGGDIWPTSELLISSFRNWANAVALWNLALDPEGGPVESPNSGCQSCTGLVTINEQTGTYTLSKDFYELGQLSHFVQPGAVRIASNHFVSYNLTPKYQTLVSPGLDDVAFENPNGSRVLFAYNNSTLPISFDLEWRGSAVSYTIPAGATTTFNWR